MEESAQPNQTALGDFVDRVTSTSRRVGNSLRVFTEQVAQSARETIDVQIENARPIAQSINLYAQSAVFKTIEKTGVHRRKYFTDFLFSDCVMCFDGEKHADVNNRVVFTIDDGPCRGSRQNSMMKEVLDLLEKHNASCTFFLVSDFVLGKEDLVEDIVRKGHEIANHMPKDVRYHTLTEEEFEKELLQCDSVLKKFVPGPVRTFRPPGGRISKNMCNVLKKHGFCSVLGDAYGNDVGFVDHPEWSAEMILNNVQPGSIIICHMPEHGFREWALKEIDLVLQGLKEKSYSIHSFGEMTKLCPEIETSEKRLPENSENVIKSKKALDDSESRLKALDKSELKAPDVADENTTEEIVPK